MQSIVFSWPGLPDYAARCIRAVIDRHPGKVTVIGTRPHVPIKGMEDSLGQSVIWIDDGNRVQDWPDLGLSSPDLFFQGGWHSPAFGALGARCRRNGGKIVCLADTAWHGGMQQLFIDTLRHRILLRRQFDGLFVPGLAGLRYSKYMGYKNDITFLGLYGSDARLFFSSEATKRRAKTFIFVGRLEPVKNIIGLVKAFEKFSRSNPEWRLAIYGSGSQSVLMPNHPKIDLFEFKQPEEISAAMRNARCLVLPSISEPWGLVVHEAALSGCALALSRSVGSAPDFADPANSVLFEAGSVDAIELALEEIASWDDERWCAAEAASIRLAANFGPQIFADSVDKFINIFLHS